MAVTTTDTHRSDDLATALTSNVVRALDRMAFVLAERSKKDPAVVLRRIVDEGPVAAARIGIALDGVQNELLLAGSPGFLTELSASLLGVEPTEVDVEHEGRYALLELANVVGGELVLLLGGRDRPLRLGLPEGATATDVSRALAAAAADGHAFASAVDTEDGHLVLVGFTGDLRTA